MIDWILSDLSTLLVAAVLLVVLGLIVYRMIRNKKSGNSDCCSGCANTFCPKNSAKK